MADSDRQVTHWPECWRDRKHWQCAVAKVERLEAKLADLRARLERLEAENKALRGNTSKSVLRRLEQCGILAAEEVKP